MSKDVDNLWESISLEDCLLPEYKDKSTVFPWDTLLALADAYEEEGLDWDARVLRRMYRIKKRPFAMNATNPPSKIVWCSRSKAIIGSLTGRHDYWSNLPTRLYKCLPECNLSYVGVHMNYSTPRLAYEAIIIAHRESITRRYPPKVRIQEVSSGGK